jgi:hypothetical protein
MESIFLRHTNNRPEQVDKLCKNKMKTATTTVTVTTERGTVVKMTTSVTRGFDMVDENLFNDGWNSIVKKAKVTEKTETTLTINGKDYKGYFTTNMPSDVLKGCFGCFLAGSQPIGLSQVKYNELIAVVESTKNEAETDQGWIDYAERKALAEKEEIEYHKNKKAVGNMMTLNGHTY